MKSTHTHTDTHARPARSCLSGSPCKTETDEAGGACSPPPPGNTHTLSLFIISCRIQLRQTHQGGLRVRERRRWANCLQKMAKKMQIHLFDSLNLFECSSVWYQCDRKIQQKSPKSTLCDEAVSASCPKECRVKMNDTQTNKERRSGGHRVFFFSSPLWR